MATANSKNNSKTMDVSSKASQSSPTSRPIIVNHGPMMQDPMVSKGESENKPPETGKETPPIQPSREKVIPAPAAASQNSPEKLEAETSAEPKTPESPEPNDTQAPPDKPEDPVTAFAGAAVKKQDEAKNQEAAAAELARKQEKLQKLVQDKKYFVKVSHDGGGSSAKTVLVLVLAAVILGIIIAVDAGVLDIGFDLPFDLIQN